jgi:hypothetical protein
MSDRCGCILGAGAAEWSAKAVQLARLVAVAAAVAAQGVRVVASQKVSTPTQTHHSTRV